MGASNAMSVYASWSGRLPPMSLHVLIYMSLVARDHDTEPCYWDGHDPLARQVFGYANPITASDRRAVRRAITPLIAAGAVTTVRRSAGRGGKKTAKYRLWIDGPAVDKPVDKPVDIVEPQDANRPTSRFDAGRKPSCGFPIHRTVSGNPQDANRPPKEEKEENYKERVLRTVMSSPGDVEGSRPGAGQDQQLEVVTTGSDHDTEPFSEIRADTLRKDWPVKPPEIHHEDPPRSVTNLADRRQKPKVPKGFWSGEYEGTHRKRDGKRDGKDGAAS